MASRLENRCNCYIIQNHGAIALGTSLEAAYNHAALLEKVAQAYYRALTTGQEITTLPEPAVYIMSEMLKSEQQKEIERKAGRQ